ncbi:hypothetical protein D0T53_05605 [Dysgonomonas sp. 216]|uniref:LptE family protein n=1 Tax=Dysgonomonas sp. 216 TaxID=2302934 RepID=UPI0013D3628A|nr:LptE family protein [Dysgonomonas sp. 216]NDW18392.1 hypothetical protein [Dysgonomonas sp. 216]
MKKASALFLMILIAVSCRVSYQFNGASIDYNIIKTIDIRDFQNQAAMVYPPLTQVFNEKLKDHYTKNTKLTFTDAAPDLELEGEIIRYDLVSQTPKDGQWDSETRLTLAVRIRFKNNKQPNEDREETISAYRDFSSSKLLTDVQDQLIDELSEEIVDQIFNATLSKW